MLLYQPRYNYELDKVYKGRTGRGRKKGMSHSGLTYPMRYGLTRSQVRELIAANQWHKFFTLWNVLRYEYLTEHGLLCICCGSADATVNLIFGKTVCKRCRKVIDKEFNNVGK